MSLGDEAAAANTRYTRNTVVGGQQSSTPSTTPQEESTVNSETETTPAE